MERREFIALVGCTTIAWLTNAAAEQTVKIWRIGFLGSAQASLNAAGEPVGSRFDAFRERMRELGYIEKKDFVVDWRFPVRPEECRELATQLVRLKVDVIVTGVTCHPGGDHFLKS
jgi:hypothetical protein